MKVHRFSLLVIILMSSTTFAQQTLSSQMKAPRSSPILPVALKGNVVPPSPAEAKDYLFWLKGKKINDSTLVTTDARVAQFSSKRNMVIVQPPQKSDRGSKLAKELSNTNARKEDIYKKIAERKSSVMMFPIMRNAFRELDEIHNDYSEILKNTITLPPSVSPNAYKVTTGTSGYASTTTFALVVPEHVRRAYNSVINDRKNYPPIDFPPPPAKEISQCLDCDSVKNQASMNEADTWFTEFSKYEAGLIYKTLSIFRSFEEQKLNSDAEAVQMRAELDKVVDFAFARLRNKVDLLIRNYGNDFTRLPSVIRAALSVERQQELYGVPAHTSGVITARVQGLFDGFDKFLENQAKAKNYDVILNLPFIISVERQRQLIGTDSNRIVKYLDMFNAVNRFRIDMHIDYDLAEESDCGRSTDKVSAELEGNQYVSLFATNCKYSILKNEDNLKDGAIHQFGMGEPLHLVMGSGVRVLKYKNDNDDCVTETHPYSRLPVTPELPDVRLSFCSDEPDSIVINRLNMVKVKDNKHSEFYGSVGNLYNMVGDYEPSEELMDELEEIQDQMEVFTLKESAQNKKLSLDEMERLHRLIARREEIAVQMDRYDDEISKFVETFDAKNGDEVLIDIEKTLRYEDELAQRTAKFIVRLRVVHDPLPFKL